ncbi:hypothetical protein NXF25_016126, partial [Crotalus adamanteus]
KVGEGHANRMSGGGLVISSPISEESAAFTSLKPVVMARESSDDMAVFEDIKPPVRISENPQDLAQAEKVLEILGCWKRLWFTKLYTGSGVSLKCKSVFVYKWAIDQLGLKQAIKKMKVFEKEGPEYDFVLLRQG